MSENETDASLDDVYLPCDCGDPNCRGYRLSDLGIHPFAVPFRRNRFVAGDDATLDQETSPAYAFVKTDSWQFDGERTDLNDLFAVLWGVYLRAAGIANIALLSERGFASQTEVSSRALFPVDWGQPYASWDAGEQKLLLAKTSIHVRNFIWTIFDKKTKDDMLSERGTFDEPPWLGSVAILLELGGRPTFELQTRQEPQWSCLTEIEKGLTVAEISPNAADILKALVSFVPEETLLTDNFVLLRHNGLANAIDCEDLAKLLSVIEEIDGEVSTPTIVPLHSHLVGVGKRSIVSIYTDCGRSTFNAERQRRIEKQRQEAAFFSSEIVFNWRKPVLDDRFESLVRELVSVEVGVVRVRTVGSAREPDDGRDLIAEWVAPHLSSMINTTIKLSEEALDQKIDVIVQAKIRTRGVGRGDVTGLRDTIEHHDCDGYLLVAFPNVTTTLHDHLLKLRRQGRFWVDWWNQSDIEDRLRLHPDIQVRYSDVVEIANAGMAT